MSKYTAQPYVFDADKYRQSHRRLIAGVGGKVADVFEKTAKKIAKIGLSTGFNSDTEEFKWSDYPVQQKQAEKAVNGMLKDLVSTIEQGQVAAWDASNLKNDEMVKAILPTTDLPEDIVASFMPRNLEALKAFQERKVSGMNLSQRIWSFKEQSVREFEMALDVALGTGKSAAELSRDIRLSLKEPNNLFRRVRDKHGNLVPSKSMQAHVAGRGVYHSSYKNALRVAATETNMAYRHSDNTRWRGMGFVLGIEVSTSINNHEPHPDMCDELEGVYPVDFEFVGWHPFCRCWAAPKLADRKEMEKYLDALQDGDDVSDYPFTGRVDDVPQGFKDWVEANKGRIKNAANKPYFIRDNYVDGDITKGFKFDKAIKAKAAARTPDQVFAQAIAQAKTMEELSAAQKSYTGDLAIGSDLRKKWAEKRSEIRNATRSEKERKAIEARIDQRKKDVAAFEKFKATSGATIKANAGQLAWFDAKQLAALDKLANRPQAYRAKAKEMAQQVAAIRKDIKELETLIPDVGTQWSKQFTSEEVHGVFDAVKKQANALHGATNKAKASKYKYEAKWVHDHPKYKTSKVAESAYTELGKKYEILAYWDDAETSLRAAQTYTGKSKKVKNCIAKLEDAYNAKDEKAFAKASEEYKKAKQAAEAKNGGKHDVKKYFDESPDLDSSMRHAASQSADTRALQKKANAKKGELEAYCTKNYSTDFTVTSQESYERKMRMLGDCTKDAWQNATQEAREAFPWYTDSSSHSLEYNIACGAGKKHAKKDLMDTILDKIATTEDMVLRSGQNFDMGYYVFGDQFGELLQKGDIDGLNKLAGLKGLNRAGMSTSFNKNGGFGKQFEFHIYAPKGTNCMNLNEISRYGQGRGAGWDGESFYPVWSSRGETEIFLARGYIMKFIKAESGTGLGGTDRIYVQLVGRLKD